MAIGLGDSGAHVGLIMDASLPTWFLSHWVRDRGEFTIEDGDPPADLRHRRAVRRRRPRRAAPGAFADVNVIDLDALASARCPSTCTTSPAAPGRYVQRGDGYDATIVNGAVFMRGGEPTGELAGTVLRSGPPAG